MSHDDKFDFDFIVIGSGFGGSVSAHRLAEKGYRVAVMEMGRRWTADNLPRTSWSIHRWICAPNLGLRGFFNMRFFKHATIFHGCAVGGGSITYACTCFLPRNTYGRQAHGRGWPTGKTKCPVTTKLRRGCSVSLKNPIGPADFLLREAAEAAGCGHTFYHTKVGIFQPADAEPGQVSPIHFLGRRSVANCLHWLRRLHDGLPPRRQEHAGFGLSISCRKARSHESFRKPE